VPNYTYPGTQVLKNRFGTISHDELEAIEGKLTAARDAELAEGRGATGSYDAAHLMAIHWHLFQDVYEWAGHTRDTPCALSDGTFANEPTLRKADGKPFLAGSLIPAALDRVSQRIREARYLRGLSRREFAEGAADIMAEINAIHAFREGNGRTQRTFIRELAEQAGYKLDFSVISRERMIQASIAANEGGDPAMMRRLFNDISDPERVTALREAIGFFVQQKFPWNDHYLAAIEPGHRIELTMAGVSGKHFLARTNTEVLVGNTADLPAPRPASGDRFVLDTASRSR
jgi:cell filamentation protein